MSENKKALESESNNYNYILPEFILKCNISDGAKLLFVVIMGLSNKSGICFASNKYLAERFGVSKRTITNRIKELFKNKLIETEIELKENSKEIQTRFIKVTPRKDFLYPMEKNFYTPTKDISTPPRKNLLTPLEENCAGNNKSINNISLINKINNNNSSILNLFNEFWSLYPKRVAKKQAQKAYEKAIKEGATHEAILEGLKKYNDYISSKKIEDRFIKHPATWLNSAGWEDEYAISKKIEIDEEADFEF